MSISLDSPVEAVEGIGPQRAEQLGKLGFYKVGDLLWLDALDVSTAIRGVDYKDACNWRSMAQLAQVEGIDERQPLALARLVVVLAKRRCLVHDPRAARGIDVVGGDRLAIADIEHLRIGQRRPDGRRIICGQPGHVEPWQCDDAAHAISSSIGSRLHSASNMASLSVAW